MCCALLFLPGTNPVRRVAAKLLGINPGTVGEHVRKVTAAMKNTPEGSRVVLPVAKMGPKKKTTDEHRAAKGDLYAKIIAHIAAAQRGGTTLTVHKLNRLMRSNDDADDFTYDHLRYHLKKLGFKWGRIQRTIKSGRTKPYVVIWLKAYCERRHEANQQGAAGDRGSEIDAFMDESALWRDEGGNWPQQRKRTKVKNH